jgi:chromosome segregation protein
MLAAIYLKGFKTFARPVRMPLECGVTAIIGPNGSGKSNITDAILFALGEGSPGVLRVGSMSDLIFSGSESLRQAEVAEVTLVVNNSSGAVSLPYEEVALTRRISRSGETEYKINGSRSRLADVRAVAGEAGLGRHSILRQGAVDAIVAGGPASCRQALEEAAGLGVYRRRRVAASRRLERADAGLEQSRRLEAELEDQLRRVEQEAAAARDYRELESRFRQVSLTCLYRTATHGLDESQEKLEHARARVKDLSAEEESLRGEEAAIEPRLRELGERLRSREQLLKELEERAESLRAESLRTDRNLLLAERGSSVEDARGRFSRLEEELRRVSGAVEELRTKSRALEAKREDRRNELAAVRREASQLRENYAFAERSRARLGGELEELEGRLRRAESLSTSVSTPDPEEVTSRIESLEGFAGERLSREAGVLRNDVAGLRRAIGTLSSEASRRGGALETSLGRAGSRVRALAEESGAGTRLREILRPRPGFEAAVEAALGSIGDGLLAEDLDEGIRLLTGAEQVAVRLDARSLDGEERPPGRPLIECVHVVDDRYADPVERLLGGIYLTDAPEGTPPENGHVLVTRAGLRLTRTSVSLSPAAGSFAREARLDEARRRLAELENGPGDLLEGLRGALSEVSERLESLSSTTSALGALAGRAERVGSSLVREAERRRKVAQRERARIAEAAGENERLRSDLSARRKDLGETTTRLEEARGSLEAVESDLSRAEERLREVEADSNRLSAGVSAGENRRRILSRELDRLRPLVAGDPLRASRLASRVADAAGEVSSALQKRRAGLRHLRSEEAEVHRRLSGERNDIARHAAKLTGDLAVARAEAVRSAEELERLQRIVAEAEEEISSEWGATIDLARQEAEQNPGASEAERRRLARKLHRFGDVNLLALSQAEEVRERHSFVATQTADAEAAATEINRIIHEIDEAIEARFSETFRKVREAFGTMIPRMMAGSSGVLELSEEGVEIGVRLGRRGWRPLRVLSGGERSLLALSFLFSIFLSRPGADSGAFCVLDEAEAALDDVNLARFLSVVDSYRSSGQFLLVTHQKRTMAAADVLYGVAQDATGATMVVSKRME